ncbi:hypothetical protein HanXRQr2_Chr17g0796741 [Helianthus annuus]|uniref:Uncharacterized protein n=1 Tax=Helianthus annuus TaxID=4232 RepID=A0A9K3DGG5_HELAN|nr:hypothetical protein HanXRQr2_Chr17g0796741 [Helianthus annuus]
MDGVNELDDIGKISNLLDPDTKTKSLDESRKTGQTSGTKLAFYSNGNLFIILWRNQEKWCIHFHRDHQLSYHSLNVRIHSGIKFLE